MINVLLVIMAAGYLTVVIGDRRRHWPWHRTACWLVGIAAAAAAVTGPLADAARHSFTAHAIGHLLIGMLAPLLLVLSAPVSLVLRALPVGYGRRLSRLLRSRPLRILTEPVVAGVLSTGGLWLIYRTDLYAAAVDRPLVHTVVHAHLVLAGALFTAVIIGTDPLPFRRSHSHRAVVLVAAVAAHAVLSKLLYTAPPAGVDRADAETGAMIMYYGGDLLHLAMMVLLCASWYRSSRPDLRVRTALGSADDHLG